MKNVKSLTMWVSMIVFGIVGAGCAGTQGTVTGTVPAAYTKTAFKLIKDPNTGLKVACGSSKGGTAMCTALVPGVDQNGGIVVGAYCTDPTDGWCAALFDSSRCTFTDNGDGTQDYVCPMTGCLSPGECDDGNSLTQDICLDDDKDNGLCYNPGLACTSGSGECANDGVSEKNSVGSWICNVAAKPATTEKCDNKDNDCDGSTDEENADECTYMYTDSDADTHGAGAAKCLCNPTGLFTSVTPDDCNDTDASIYPTAPEKCDGKDNDCDGVTDEGYTDLTDFCEVGVGECWNSGTKVCKADGSGTECSASPWTASDESCDNKDNDCDGQTDEGCDDDLDDWCDTGMALAEGGSTACPNGGGDCNDLDSVANPGKSEICNAVDDNCNGQTDEGFNIGATCSVGTGECTNTGVKQCKADGSNWECSVSANEPSAESCDNKDNDCDGNTDEGCDDDNDGWCDASMTIAEGGATVCSSGINDCDDGSANRNPGKSEICNAVDDNCNGQTDEGFNIGATCSVGTGECTNTGVKQCKADGSNWECSVLEKTPTTEICDNKDNDCDGQTDEDGICSPAASPTQIACGETVPINTGTDLNAGNVFTSWEAFNKIRSGGGKEEVLEPMATSGTWTLLCVAGASSPSQKGAWTIYLLDTLSATPDKDVDGDGTKETGSKDMVQAASLSSLVGTFGVNKWVVLDTAINPFIGTCKLTCTP